MIEEKTIYEENGVRIFVEVETPSEKKFDSRRCTCDRSFCCGKHENCSKAAVNNRVYFKKGRTY